MVTKEEVFRRWNILLKRIDLSTEKYKNKKCKQIGDIYFSKHKIVGEKEYIFIECFADSPERNAIKGDRIMVDFNDFYNYYINGWDKQEEYLALKDLYKQGKYNIKSNYNQNRFSVYNDFWTAQRGINRLKTEKRSLEILLRYLKLKKVTRGE